MSFLGVRLIAEGAMGIVGVNMTSGDSVNVREVRGYLLELTTSDGKAW
ncbi:hypothetical protein [Paraburkholderia caribensis]|nr:hypothetical protein [Paraburkholderia caribensis]